MQPLCQLVGDYRGALPTGQWCAQEKRDGWRATWFRGIDGLPQLWTRSGIPIRGTAHIAARCRAMEEAAGGPLVIDGEFQVDGTLAATKAWAERGSKLGGCAGTFYAFDCLTQADWQRGEASVPWIERQNWLWELMDRTQALSRSPAWLANCNGHPVPERFFEGLPGELITSAAGVAIAAQEVWSRGGEGLVLKRLDSPYQRRRSPDWLKVKQGQAWIAQIPPIAA